MNTKVVHTRVYSQIEARASYFSPGSTKWRMCMFSTGHAFSAYDGEIDLHSVKRVDLHRTTVSRKRTYTQTFAIRPLASFITDDPQRLIVYTKIAPNSPGWKAAAETSATSQWLMSKR